MSVRVSGDNWVRIAQMRRNISSRAIWVSAAALLGILAGAANAATVYWDTMPGTVGVGNGSITGGAGTWNTTIGNWTTDGGANNVAWVNANNDTAVFGGMAGTVTLGTGITVGGLEFDTAGYSLTGNQLTFGAPGSITTNADATIHSVLGGGAAITKAGTGTLTISGANIYTGMTILTRGTLSIGTSNNLGNGSATNTLIFNGGTLRITGTTLTKMSDLTNGGTRAITYTAAKTVGLDIANAANTFTVDQVLNQTTGGLNKYGAGTLILTGANMYSGNTAISGGTLRLAGSNSYGGGTILTAGTLQLGGTTNGGLATGTLTFGNATSGAAVIQAINADKTIANNVVLNGNGTISGSKSLQINGTFTNIGGNFTLINTIDSGKALTLGAVNISGDTICRRLTIGGTGNTMINGAIGNGPIATNCLLTKTDAGTLTLSGNNTYTGATSVNSGTLLVNGSLAAGSAVTVNNGGNLGGTGTINGPVTALSGGHIALGTDTLTIGSLTMSAGSIYDYQFNSTGTNGLIRVNTPGGLTMNGGGFNLYSQGGTTPFAIPGAYTLLQYSGALAGTGTSALSVLNPLPGTSYTFSNSAGAVNLTIGAPAPPQINPQDPPAQLAKYQFVTGITPSLTWTPLTVGLNFELAVPGIEPLSYTPSFTWPDSAWSPSIPPKEYAFSTNNVWLGKALSVFTPWDFHASMTVTAGVKGGVEAALGLIAREGDSTWKIGGNLDLGVWAFVEVELPFLSSIPYIGSKLPSSHEFDLPLFGIPPLEASAEVPVGSLFSYSAFKNAISTTYGISEAELSGQVMVGTIPINFDDGGKTVTVGISAEAVAFAQTSVTASVGAYFHKVEDFTEALPLSQFAGTTTWGQAAPFSELKCVQSSSGSSTIYGDGSLRMITGSPVWITNPVDVTSVADTLVFDAQFDANSSGTGLLSVCIDGQLVVLIDQGEAGTDLQTYVLALPQRVNPGVHVLSFRMDPESSEAASISIDNVALGFSGIPEPGDGNGDGVVDAADYILLKRHMGTSTGAGATEGDFNYDGTVDFADLQILMSGLGTATGGVSAKTPEPATLGLLALGALAVIRRARRRPSFRP